MLCFNCRLITDSLCVTNTLSPDFSCNVEIVDLIMMSYVFRHHVLLSVISCLIRCLVLIWIDLYNVH